MKIKNLKNTPFLIISLSICLIIATSCSKINDKISQETTRYTTQTQSQAISPTETTTIETTIATNTVSETTTEPPVISNFINPLTGCSGLNEQAVGKRPIAVMINNLKQSLPQYGIEDADVLYEIPVESGITRLMGIYADYIDMPDICSIRSCRYYFPIIAYGMDAIYCHWGADQTIATETLNRLEIDNIDGYYSGYQTVFFRDPNRMGVYDKEHTGYLKGSNIANTINQFGIRTDVLPENSENIFKFNSENSPIAPAGTNCTFAELNFSGSYFSTFSYNSQTGLYEKTHSGSPHMDSATGNQLAYKNVFILRTNISKYGIGELMKVDTYGGSGYYISNGGAMEINWNKSAENQPIKVTDLNGNEISVNAGKSYIGIIGYDCPLTVAP